ncbi:cytochrome P450 [Nocardioides zeae]|uniref:Cytochrome P450 n=1 Tax=Nocardioides zeae TaxID=1457234 RepID=A0ACC6IEF6_9ACTN|nr:cytochrome P450 [Nocardioides zeae]MDR6174186.1 cytochrome P450 [Nocardioides zeae]MDR6208993.1 cytochrome P450 [Nocardioides zeae]
MTVTQTEAISDLPLLTDLVPLAEWSRDLCSASRTLLAGDHDLLRHPDGGVVAVRNATIRSLAEDPAVGNAPVSFLTGRSDDRLRRARETAEGSRCPVDAEPLRHFLRNQVFTMNPPEHTELRRALARPLMPRPVRSFVGLAEQVLDALLEELVAAGGEIDFGRDLAAVFATRFWTEQLGLPDGHAARIQHLMEEMNLQFRFNPAPDDSARARAATREYMALLESLVGRALEAGPNDLLDVLTAGARGSRLDDEPVDVRANVASNFFDAFHTVGVAITNAVHHLLASPEHLAALRRDPALAAQVFAEGTRISPPLMLTTRVTLADVRHGDLLLPAGTAVHMIWVAGNHDPDAFPDPERFDPSRPARSATTFGGGAHVCPGRNAARMLGEVVLHALTAPGLHVEQVGTPQWVEGSGIRHLDSFRVRISRPATSNDGDLA